MKPAKSPLKDEIEFWTPDFWRKYCESGNPYRQYKLQRDTSLAIKLLRPSDGERILEVGCGYGRISQALIASAKIRLVTVDFSSAMLRACKQTLETNFSGCRADAGRLPFREGSFDAVLCTGVLMHLEDQLLAMRELCRVLRPGGRLLVSANNLLSPFALPMSAWVRLNHKARQEYNFPWFYRSQLTQLGVEVRKIVGDTFLAVALMIPGSNLSLIPRVFFRSLRALDRWVDRPPLNYLAYETWFLGAKVL